MLVFEAAAVFGAVEGDSLDEQAGGEEDEEKDRVFFDVVLHEHGGTEEGGKQDERPIEDDEHEDSAEDEAEKDGEPIPFGGVQVVGELNAEEGTRACTGKSDHHFLEEKRDDGAGDSGEESEENPPLVFELERGSVGKDGEAEREADRGDEEPVEFASGEQNRQPDERDRQIRAFHG